MATFFSLADLGLSISSAAMLDLWLQSMQSQFPGYNPSQGSLEYIQAQTFASWGADLGSQASSGGTELFRTFGTSLLGLPYQTGVSAQALVTVGAAALDSGIISNNLPIGTQFVLDGLGFVSVTSTSIDSGTAQPIILAAVETGSAYNGAGASGGVSLVSQIDWVSDVSLITSASGGIDPEDDTHYLNRLAGALQLMAPRPITAADYAGMAISFNPTPGTDEQQVGRATALDGYNPLTNTYGNERTVTVAVTDALGGALTADTKTALQAWFQARREVNFVVNVIDPTYTLISVQVGVHKLAAYDDVTVQLNIQTALIDYLSPNNWGLPGSGSSGAWSNVLTIHRSRLESVIQACAGVDYVDNGTLAMQEGIAGFTTTSDISLDGPVGLPTADTSSIALSGITVT